MFRNFILSMTFGLLVSSMWASNSVEQTAQESVLKDALKKPVPIETSPERFRRLIRYGMDSELIYHSDEKIREVYPDAEIGFLPDTQVKYMIIEEKDHPWQKIVMRGTDNWRNVIVDAKYISTTADELGIKVHRGFYQVAKEFIAVAGRQLSKDKRLNFTGHSLGGASSIIAAMLLELQGFNIGEIVTFGQPRITNKAGGMKYKHMKVLRVVNKADLVTMLAPMAISIYNHFGSAVVLYPDSGYKYYPDGTDYHLVPHARRVEAEAIKLWDQWNKEAKMQKLHDLPIEKLDLRGVNYVDPVKLQGNRLAWFKRHTIDVYLKWVYQYFGNTLPGGDQPK